MQYCATPGWVLSQVFTSPGLGFPIYKMEKTLGLLVLQRVVKVIIYYFIQVKVFDVIYYL